MTKATQGPLAPAPQDDDFARLVTEGLSRPRKSLPCRFFYDAAGSALFEDITRQPEYYPTRTELSILKAHAARMLESDQPEEVLVEFGSGSSIKTEVLLREGRALRTYVPIDISRTALEEARRRLRARFPGLDVRPLRADFSRALRLAQDLAVAPKLGFFPGSTIGNFAPAEAAGLLRAMRETLSPDARLLIGVDLEKDPGLLIRAYDDARGVTAAFNLNLLARINRELGATFDLGAFRHKAIYNRAESRVEMHLVSLEDQTVKVGAARFCFRAGETIHTENAYKYSLDAFRATARAAGWTPRRVWMDEANLFSVHDLAAPL